MPRFIMKLHDDKDNVDYYLEWSTIVDAPVTWGMSLDEFKEYYKQEYGEDGMRGLDDRLKRVGLTGVSAHPPFQKLSTYFNYNRAGKNESTLTKQQIIEKYCKLKLVE